MADDRRLRFASVVFAALAAISSTGAAPLRIGDPVPVAELPRAGGGSLQVGALGDAGALVVFHSSSCPAAAAWEAALVDLGNRATERLVRTTIVDPAATGEELRKRSAEPSLRFDWVADQDGSAARAFGASLVPEAFLFDGGGHLVYRGALGTRDGQGRDYLAEALDAMLDRRPIPLARTVPEGCPIPPGK